MWKSLTGHRRGRKPTGGLMENIPKKFSPFVIPELSDHATIPKNKTKEEEPQEPQTNRIKVLRFPHIPPNMIETVRGKVVMVTTRTIIQTVEVPVQSADELQTKDKSKNSGRKWEEQVTYGHIFLVKVGDRLEDKTNETETQDNGNKPVEKTIEVLFFTDRPVAVEKCFGSDVAFLGYFPAHDRQTNDNPDFLARDIFYDPIRPIPSDRAGEGNNSLFQPTSSLNLGR